MANGLRTKTSIHASARLNWTFPKCAARLNFIPPPWEKANAANKRSRRPWPKCTFKAFSTRKTTAILEQLCGLEISSSHVSQATAKLDVQFEAWRQRPLGTFPYLVVDARYEKVRVDGRVRDCAVLITIGISLTGQRTILGVSVSLSEAEVHWREFFNGLIARGLRGVTFIVSGRPCRITPSPPSLLSRRALATLPVSSPTERAGLRPQDRHAQRGGSGHPLHL